MKLHQLRRIIREEFDKVMTEQRNWKVGQTVAIPADLQTKIKDSLRREPIGGAWSHTGKPDVAKSFVVTAIKPQGTRTMLQLQQKDRNGIQTGQMWINSEAVEPVTGITESAKKDDKPKKDDKILPDFHTRYDFEFHRGDQVEMAKNITDTHRKTMDIATKAELELVDQSEPFEIVSAELQGEQPVYVVQQNYINIKVPAAILKPINDK